jgi:hypothetical protein
MLIIATLLKLTNNNKLNWLKYYVPPNSTITFYVTEPIINAGIPVIVYETYHNDIYTTIKNHAMTLF